MVRFAPIGTAGKFIFRDSPLDSRADPLITAEPISMLASGGDGERDFLPGIEARN